LADAPKTVTGLRETGRGVRVELDGAPWRNLPADVVVRAGLTVGTQVDRSCARSVRRELRRHEALNRAARALRSQDLPQQRLDERLARAGFVHEERSEALGALERAGLVDDARYASGRAAVLADRGWGDAAIVWRLEQAGIAPELAEAALASLVPEADRARELAAHRGGGSQAARFLATRGFAEESVEAAAGAEW
jgi:SOS response regulatory protein OraA/RecX